MQKVKELMAQEEHAQVLTGTLSNVKVTNTVSDVFFRAGDREGMAATGVAAAALGESGLAAGMTAMSTEEMSDQVCLVSFDLDGKHVEGMLWNWPFKDGDEVRAVVEPAENGSYTCFAVVDPKEQIIVLYPHVSAGARAHWRNVIKLSFLAGVVPAFVFTCVLVFIGEMIGVSLIKEPIFLLAGFSGCTAIVFFIGIRMGYRFTPFIEMAEPIFTLLGWKDVKNINLRKTTKAKKKPTDPPAMGDSYFRY
ncbi:putative type VI secretion system effector [Xanthomonas euvesicatoria]|uniref:putative type VI secretion system effector n=1 Tax=Xanthomonas citri TaxID=346 RepID=UPI001D03DE94|nr:putative type VI secretion system effector [Xanthomonas axonopodis]MEE5091858.1 putative type VI secretion system effector [Xanthomonas euvesicatoria]